jgi:phosphatidylinositol phospholipase C delta
MEPAVVPRLSPLGATAFLASLEKTSLEVDKVSKLFSRRQKRVFSSRDDGTVLSYTPSSKSVPPMCSLDDVEDVLLGTAAVHLFDSVELGPDESWGACLAIRRGEGTCWRLIAPNPQTAAHLAAAIASQVVIRRGQCSMIPPLQARLLRSWHHHVQSLFGGDTTSVVAILAAEGVPVQQEAVARRFARFDGDCDGLIDFAAFCDLAEEILRPACVRALFARIAEPGGTMSRARLHHFFNQIQGDNIDVTTTQRRLQAITRSSVSQQIAAEEFTGYLLDPTLNGWMKPEHEGVFMDMTQPLHHYYIAASHNTALTGDQYVSEATPEWVGMVLRQGARALELEVCDGAEEPLVHRRYSQCVPCSLRRVLEVIRVEAFAEGASRFPLIVMLELHTSKEGERATAALLTEVLGDRIYRKTHAENSGYADFRPDRLVGRILLMASEDGSPGTVKRVPKQMRKSHDGSMSLPLDCCGLGVDMLDLCCLRQTARLDWGVFAEGFEGALVPAEVLSEASAADRDTWVARSRRQLVVSYPRDPSFNPDPQLLRRCGVQLGSMVYLDCDEHMRLSEALFRVNGACGYILKPLYLRDQQAAPITAEYTLSINIIAGFQLPRPEDMAIREVALPFVQVLLTGINAEEPITSRTPVASGCEDPVFNHPLTFRFTGVETAAITVRLGYAADGPDVFAADASLPVTSLRPGYRCVPLMDTGSGEALPCARLLCHFIVNKVRGE